MLTKIIINASKKVRKGLIIASKHTKTRQMLFKAIIFKLETSLFHPPLFFEKFIFQIWVSKSKIQDFGGNTLIFDFILAYLGLFCYVLCIFQILDCYKRFYGLLRIFPILWIVINVSLINNLRFRKSFFFLCFFLWSDRYQRASKHHKAGFFFIEFGLRVVKKWCIFWTILPFNELQSKIVL